MKIRHLRIKINTEKGLHGTDIEFPDGLVVIRADNSMGKSTCIQSILVALGLEAMLTTSQRDLPLPPVMKEELDSNGSIVKVLESDIFLEIENKSKERIVVHRSIKGTRNKDLVTVIFGPALTNEQGYYASEDFFVSRSGAATRERGFHRFLAEFLGWNLPEVQTFEGRQSPLYLQCIFPYFSVEQKRGWASLLPPIPTQFRIRDPHKRAVEFLLNLDASTIAAKRLELNERVKNVELAWTNNANELSYLANAIGGVARNVPERPIAQWPPEIMPSIQIPRENRWLQIGELLELNKTEQRELIKQEIPLIGTVTETASTELSQTQEDLNEKEVILAKLLNSLEMERGEVRAIETRLERIEEDIQRNKDARTIASLGSLMPSVTQQICPTCHQHIEDTLLPLGEEQQVMSIEDNIAFLDEQHRTFQAALKSTKLLVIARESQITQMREYLRIMRMKIRAIRETLVSDERLPSMEAIRKRIELDTEINRQNSALEQFQIKLGRFEPLADEWLSIQREREGLPGEDISPLDKQKLKKWNEIFIEQLIKYDFQSLPPDTVSISVDTYGPIHEGFDLPSNISASDFIRIIWSYLTGLLGVAHEFETNHPGFLIFDEPRQQSAKNLSFAALLDEAAESIKYGQQVIFATSENLDVLKQSLKYIPHNLVSFSGRIVQSLSSK